MTLNVQSSNDLPVGVHDNYVWPLQGPLTIDAVGGVLANDNDVDGTTLTASLLSTPAHGQLSFETDGSFLYLPNETYWPTDSFTYLVSDGQGVSATVVVDLHGSRPTGDANGDGQFDSNDLIAVFQLGQYEDQIANNSTFAAGDWNGDLEFDSSDLVAAFQMGGYADAARGRRSTFTF